MEPTIGIVVPAFNCSRFLRETIASVQRQTWSNWELLVVDDGSTDDTPGILHSVSQEDSRITWLAQANGGVASARNTGLAALSPKSTYVMLLDHDDVLADDAIERLYRILEGSPAAVGSHGVAQMIDIAGLVIGPGDRSIQNLKRKKMVSGIVQECARDEPTTRGILIYDNCLCTPGQALIRREHIPSAESFNAAFAPLDDWEFYIRLSSNGYLAYTDQVVIYWRRHDKAQSSANVAGMQRAELAVRQALVAANGFSDDEQKTARYRLMRLYATIHRRQARTALGDAHNALVRLRFLDAISRVRVAISEYALYVRAKA